MHARAIKTIFFPGFIVRFLCWNLNQSCLADLGTASDKAMIRGPTQNSTLFFLAPRHWESMGFCSQFTILPSPFATLILPLAYNFFCFLGRFCRFRVYT